jgi:hypothetical protein
VPPQGYAFAEFLDIHVTDIVIQNLNGKPCNTKFLTGASGARLGLGRGGGPVLPAALVWRRRSPTPSPPPPAPLQ